MNSVSRSVLSAACLTLAVLSAIHLPAQAAESPESSQLKLTEALDAAWNRGDVDAMVALMTADAEYVNAGNGFYWKGKEEMRRGWQEVIASGGPATLGGISSIVLVRQSGQWRITFGQSTLVSPPR